MLPHTVGSADWANLQSALTTQHGQQERKIKLVLPESHEGINVKLRRLHWKATTYFYTHA